MNTVLTHTTQSNTTASSCGVEGGTRLALPASRYRAVRPARHRTVKGVRRALRWFMVGLAAVGSTACVHNQVLPQSNTVQGSAPGPVTGAAAGATSVDGQVERCKETLGTLAIDDGRQQSWWGDFQRATQVTTLEPMIRLVVQQSNCFMITVAGNAELDAKTRKIMDNQRNSGETRIGSNLEKGQKIASDYFLKPDIVFKESRSSNQGGALSGLLKLPFAVGGSVSTSNAQVSLSLVNLRAGTVIAGAAGNASSTQFNATVAGIGVLGQDAGFGGMSRTPQGQATLAAFVDAYNQMVVGLKNYKQQTVRGGAGTGGLLKAQGQ